MYDSGFQRAAQSSSILYKEHIVPEVLQCYLRSLGAVDSDIPALCRSAPCLGVSLMPYPIGQSQCFFLGRLPSKI